jgi:hypothetical protein
MSDTPETDAAQHEGLLRTNPIPMQVVTANFARRLERERDEAREVASGLAQQAERLRKERFEARKLALAFHEDQTRLLMENAKLRDIAERAIDEMEGGDPVGTADAYRAELEQLKEGGK